MLYITLGQPFNVQPRNKIDIFNKVGIGQSGLFTAQHGSWNRTKPIGARIMFTSLKADGTADKTEVFADGWLDSETGLYRGRPVDVAMMKDGSMLISNDFAGALYRVTYVGDAK